MAKKNECMGFFVSWAKTKLYEKKALSQTSYISSAIETTITFENQWFLWDRFMGIIVDL